MSVLSVYLFLAFSSVDIDSGYYTVKFDSLLLKEAVVEGDSIIPPLRSEDGASSAESDEDSVDDSGYAKGERVVRVRQKCLVICACLLSGTWSFHCKCLTSHETVGNMSLHC